MQQMFSCRRRRHRNGTNNNSNGGGGDDDDDDNDVVDDDATATTTTTARARNCRRDRDRGRDRGRDSDRDRPTVVSVPVGNARPRRVAGTDVAAGARRQHPLAGGQVAGQRPPAPTNPPRTHRREPEVPTIHRGQIWGSVTRPRPVRGRPRPQNSARRPFDATGQI